MADETFIEAVELRIDRPVGNGVFLKHNLDRSYNDIWLHEGDTYSFGFRDVDVVVSVHKRGDKNAN